jgi:hypothetical protein
MTLATATSVFLHRELFRDELAIRTVARGPATSIDPHTGILNQEPATRIGLNMSGALTRRLGHPEGYGQTYPWARALWLLRVECRRKHPHHRSADRPYWRGSLCHQSIVLTVIGGANGGGPMTVHNASKVLQVDKLDVILKWSFRFIEDAIDDAREKAERKARLDEGQAIICTCGHSYSRHGGIVERWKCQTEACGCPRYLAVQPAHEHEGLPGVHRDECPQCRRAA